MMRIRGRSAAVMAAAAMMLSTVMVASPTSAGGAPSGRSFTATSLSSTSRITAAKSVTGKLAESDPALLGRTDATIVNVVVKLDYDATASYDGNLTGLPATSPSVTGTELTGDTPAEVAYEDYTGTLDTEFRQDVASKVPSAKVGRSLKRVYGGVAMRVPANQVGALLALPNVAAVQTDTLNQLQTDSSTTFIGAPTIWAQNGGQSLAGHGVIFGDLDSGVWPEHPSFADNPALGDPPPKADGTPRECNYGDNPLTPAADPFVCNHKLIGGEPFLDSYNAIVGGEVYGDSARDSDGHGTHTTSTAAGGIVDSAPIFGTERGPISGVAPGAWVIEYKVCGAGGCFGSDTAAAVEQAILDGVDVINFSISGGANPYADPTELAFLDAYEAGITVAASAGNSGPAAGSTDHRSPWVVTVAASTQTRAFESTLTVTDGDASATFVGSSITAGVADPTPVVLAKDIPGYDANCSTELPPGSVAGKIVACARGGIGRVQKGYNVLQGGAVGMILYNPTLQDTETDNHFLPAVHLADGADFLAFMAAHPTASASFTAGVKAEAQGDVMASFSSRGPGGLFLKPDITAPGVQILAGNTPTPDAIPAGPAGEYFQAIAGTSMSAPHIAGSAILLQSLHPDWSPGAIKSAMMTTATTNVVKEDTVTPADPFDFGAGRVDLTQAGAAAIVFDDSALNMYQYGNDPIAGLNLNTPSVNVPTMPGVVEIHRTATNVTNRNYDFSVAVDAPAGSKIRVFPNHGRIRAGQSKEFRILITSKADAGQYFGKITFNSSTGAPQAHLPVAFYNQQGSVALTQTCDPTTIKERDNTTCTVSATNTSFTDAAVSATTTVTNGLKITGANGAYLDRKGTYASAGPAILAGQKDAVPAIAAGPTPGSDPVESPYGYLPLEVFGIAQEPIGDEENVNFTVPAFVYGGQSYSRIGVDSNGYISVGGSDSNADIAFEPQTLPDSNPPNGVLAPYWTDLNGDGIAGDGIRVGLLGDGTNSWVVVQWNIHVYGDDSPAGARAMQVWLGVNGTEDISYGYDPATVGLDAPPGAGLTVGAENVSGTGGAQIAGPPTSSYVVTTSPGAPGGSLTYVLTIKGVSKGNEKVTTSMTSDIVAGTTKVVTPVRVQRR